MILVDQTKLKSFIRYIDAKLDHPLSLYIAGGSAVVILCPDAQSTKDIDTFSSNELLIIQKISKFIPPDISLDINNGINTFEPTFQMTGKIIQFIHQDFLENISRFIPFVQKI